MSDNEIIDRFDTSNITLEQLSQLSGKSVKYLKKLLMGG
jgi:predicted HTH domain antitoxin